MQASVWEPIFNIPLLFTQRRDVKYSTKCAIWRIQCHKEQSQPGTVTLSAEITFHQLRIILLHFCLIVLLGIHPNIIGLILIKVTYGPENTYTSFLPRLAFITDYNFRHERNENCLCHWPGNSLVNHPPTQYTSASADLISGAIAPVITVLG